MIFLQRPCPSGSGKVSTPPRSASSRRVWRRPRRSWRRRRRRRGAVDSGARLAQLYQDSCFLHDAKVLAKRGRGHSPRTLTFRQVRALCTKRADWTSDHCHCYWERREGRGEHRKRTKEKRKKKGRERERERERLPVCRFKTSPCAGSKGLRVYRQNARMCSTCERFASTHRGVLNLAEVFFLAASSFLLFVTGCFLCVSLWRLSWLFHTFLCEGGPRILRSSLGQSHVFCTSPSIPQLNGSVFFAA